MLIEFSDKGLYCRQGNFYIDPWKPVDRAIITHAHSDHMRAGSKWYLCHYYTKPLLLARLGEHPVQTVEWNETVDMNGAKVSLHPAGHIIGSSQIRVEYKGEVWVVSGDYKIKDDGISGAFEPVKCNVFITESTFGLPIYKWKPQADIYDDIKSWIGRNKEKGVSSVLIAYSLGKGQRVLQPVSEMTDTIYVHGAIANMQRALEESGWNFPQVERITPETPKSKLAGSVVIAPPSADGTPWMKKFSPFAVGVCSGWMQVRGSFRRRNADAGFALSDHADWDGLLEAIHATEAEKVYATHGFQSALSRYLNEHGIEAGEVHTEYGNDEEETGLTAPYETITEEKEDNEMIEHG